MTLSDLERRYESDHCPGRSLYVRSYHLTKNDQIWHANTSGEGACFYGVNHDHSQTAGPKRLPNFMGPPTHRVICETITKFCMVIKPDEI